MFRLQNALKTALLLAALAAAMLACSTSTPAAPATVGAPDSGSTSTHTPPSPTPTLPRLSFSQTPTTALTSTPARPTEVPPAPTAAAGAQAFPGAQVISGPQIAWNGISFELDPVFGSRVFVYDAQIESPEGLAAHYTRFALAEEEYCQSWCVQVYPLEQFQTAFGRFVFPPAGYGGGAAIILHAQDQPLNFQNGEGQRALEMHGQMSFFVSNETLFYIFRGYSDDQQYAVYIKIPIDAAILASTGDPEQNTNPDAILIPTTPPDVAYPQDAILAYNQEAVRQLNLLAGEAFDPGLSVVDALVASLQIESSP